MWRLNPKVRLVWREVGGEWLVFEELSGQTHQIDALTAATLNCFEEGAALDRPALARRLHEAFGLDPADLQSAALDAVLAQFATLGLTVAAAAPASSVMHAHAAV